MQTILVEDTSSLINLTKFYYFDRYNEKRIFTSISDFLTLKIQSNEIRIIDKVYTEWYETEYNKDLREKIEDSIIGTEFLIPEVQNLINDYKNQENISLLHWTDEEIELELDDYESGKIADLYLITYCKHLKNNGENPILITEETRKNDGKIIQKIPTICQREHIRYQNLPYSLFEIYKNKLKFNLTVI